MQNASCLEREVYLEHASEQAGNEADDYLSLKNKPSIAFGSVLLDFSHGNGSGLGLAS